MAKYNIPDEEKDVVGAYMADISDTKPLSREKEAELAVRIAQGDLAARDELVQANLRFVVNMATVYQNRGLSLADLISSGNLGLITAAERFSEKKGTKFISYAVWWIRQAILQAIAEHARTIRVPITKLSLLAKIHKTQAALELSGGGKPSVEEIALELDEKPHHVAEMLINGRSQFSLDQVLSGEEERTLLDTVSDLGSESPDQALMRHSLHQEAERALDRLSGHEAEVLRLYFGWDGEDPLTLDQIGARFGITRERTRQIKEKALWHLRDTDTGSALREFYSPDYLASNHSNNEAKKEKTAQSRQAKLLEQISQSLGQAVGASGLEHLLSIYEPFGALPYIAIRYFLDGLEITDMARLMKYEPGQIKSQVERARMWLMSQERLADLSHIHKEV